MVYRLIYVSRSELPSDEADQIVGSIVAVAAARNARDDITGALLFSGTEFAQVLEGPMPAVLRLIADIAADRGHSDIEIVGQGEVSARSFGDWRMGYWGRSAFVTGLIKEARSSVGLAFGRAGHSRLLRFMSDWAQERTAA